MALARRPLRLQEIAHAVSMPQSTVSRFVSALVTAGYATQNSETLKYQLTLRFCKIGDALRAQFNIRDICKPYLYALAQKSKEAAFIYAEENMTAVCLDFANSPDGHVRTVTERVGRTVSMHSTASGKILLLGYSDEMLEKFLTTRGLPPRTDNTITDRTQFMIMLDHVREDGFAVDDEENELGMSSIAAPILDYDGKVVAAVEISSRSNRLSYYEINRIKDYVIESASAISAALGYRVEEE